MVCRLSSWVLIFLLRLVSLSIVGHTVYFLQKLSFPLVKDSHRSCQLIFQQDTHILPTNDYFRIHTSFLSPLFRGRGAPLFTHIFHAALLFVSLSFHWAQKRNKRCKQSLDIMTCGNNSLISFLHPPTSSPNAKDVAPLIPELPAGLEDTARYQCQTE